MKLVLIVYALFCILPFFVKGRPLEKLTAYEMNVSLIDNPLPISISSLIQPTSIKKITLRMGHLTNASSQFSFPRGITAYIENVTQLSTTIINQIKSLFLISQDRKFQIYLPTENILLFSDPNDQLCTEHIEHLFKYFYPCRNYASLRLDKLITPSKLLEGYLVIQFLWLVTEQQIQFKIFLPRDRHSASINNSHKICGNISVYELSSDFESNLNHKVFQNMVRYECKTIDKWYSQQKCIAHSLQIQKPSINSTVKLITLLPYGFIYQNYSVNPPNLNFELTQQKFGEFLFHIFVIPLQSEASISFTIHINFRSSLPPFQNFQTISGGGEEIMNVPLFIENGRIYQLHSNLISQRLLEPDFSIPFQTITFTIGIVGYLWINLWRLHKVSPERQGGQKRQ